jgi:selenophosphate synthetase-related protein
VKDGESPGGVGKKEHVMNRVVVDVARVCRGIADGDDMTCVRVDDEELVVLASGESLTVGAVDGEAGWTGAWCELP